MKSVYGFVVKPDGERYNNKINVGEKELILNSEIYSHQFVNRKAKVVSVPIESDDLGIKPGDTIIIHHNVFRRWNNVKGIEKNSRSFFKDDLYIINEDQIFLRKHKNNWIAPKGFCFVKPIKSTDDYDNDVEDKTRGIVKYTDGSVDVDQLVGFEPFSKYEFVIDGEKLYRVYSKFITIKYEYQGNEEAYNPSWAQSS
jgi:hypothetical protein